MCVAQCVVANRLRAAASLCDELEARGYSATIRLVSTGFRVHVAKNFHQSNRLVTFEDVASRPTNMLVEVIENAAQSCPKLSWEVA